MAWQQEAESNLVIRATCNLVREHALQGPPPSVPTYLWSGCTAASGDGGQTERGYEAGSIR
eukprot:1162112-Pelagomonas_calceolata.AAC.4